MGLPERSQPLLIWRAGPAVPGEWVRDDVRDALRSTSYALAGLALSLFGFGVVAPASVHVFTFTAGGGEFTLAVFWWIYAGRRSARVEQLTGLDRVLDVVNARHLATMYTLVGLAVSADLLLVAVLAPPAGSAIRHLRVLGLHGSISGPQAGTIGLVGFFLILGVGFLLGAIWHRRTHKSYSLALYFKICEELAGKACTLDDLEQAGLSRENAQRWLSEAESNGFVTRRGTAASEHWELTEKAAVALRREGYAGPIHTGQIAPGGGGSSAVLMPGTGSPVT